MPTRFLLTDADLVREHVNNAVALLWTAGQDSILSLDLKKVENELQIPAHMTLLMMGTTDELEAQLRHVKGRRIEAITAAAPSGGEAFLIPKGARKWTADPQGVHVPQQLSVVALHGGNEKFDKSWKPILPTFLFTPPITIGELIDELPEIRKL
jgi:hypothetical protein